MSTAKISIPDLIGNPLYEGDLILWGQSPSLLRGTVLLSIEPSPGPKSVKPFGPDQFGNVQLLTLSVSTPAKLMSPEDIAKFKEVTKKRKDPYWGYPLTYYFKQTQYGVIKPNVLRAFSGSTILLKTEDTSTFNVCDYNLFSAPGLWNATFSEELKAEIKKLMAKVSTELPPLILTGEDIRKLLKPYNAKLKELTAPAFTARYNAILNGEVDK